MSLAQGLMMMARQVILTVWPLYSQTGLGRDAFELRVYVALRHGMGTASSALGPPGSKAVLVPSCLWLTGLHLLVGRVAPRLPLSTLLLKLGIVFDTLTHITGAVCWTPSEGACRPPPSVSPRC